MFRCGGVALAVVTCGSAYAQALPLPGDVLFGLIGSCWQADLGDGATDSHCFSVAQGGKLVMDVHKVRGRTGDVMYEGATLYRLEKETATVRYDYYNSNGDLLTGYAKRDGNRIRFPDKPEEAGDLVWSLSGDGYEVGSAATASAKRKFVRLGPAPDGGL